MAKLPTRGVRTKRKVVRMGRPTGAAPPAQLMSRSIGGEGGWKKVPFGGTDYMRTASSKRQKRTR